MPGVLAYFPAPRSPLPAPRRPLRPDSPWSSSPSGSLPAPGRSGRTVCCCCWRLASVSPPAWVISVSSHTPDPSNLSAPGLPRSATIYPPSQSSPAAGTSLRRYRKRPLARHTYPGASGPSGRCESERQRSPSNMLSSGSQHPTQL